jgi:hypothetical protein
LKEKKVPQNIGEFLTYRGLAYWIMDDGSIKNKGLHLNTYAFLDEDVELLLNTLKKKKIFFFIYLPLGLKCIIRKHSSGGIICFWEESMESLRANLSEYMYRDMLYKIGVLFSLLRLML